MGMAVSPLASGAKQREDDLMDFVLQISDEKTAIAGFAAFGLTTVDAKGVRSVRQGGMISKVDMEVLADAVSITQDRVAADIQKGGQLDATNVERLKINPMMAVKPKLDTLKEKQDYRRDLTEWCTVSLPQRMVPTGNTYTDPFGNEQPELAADGFYYIVLRWNGDAMLPPMPPGFEIIWSSIVERDKVAPEYPSGLPRFA